MNLIIIKKIISWIMGGFILIVLVRAFLKLTDFTSPVEFGSFPVPAITISAAGLITIAIGDVINRIRTTNWMPKNKSEKNLTEKVITGIGICAFITGAIILIINRIT